MCMTTCTVPYQTFSVNFVLQAINALGLSMFANNALLGCEVRVRVWIPLMANLDITLTLMLQKK